MEKAKDCYGYARVSGLSQIDGTGLDRQEEAIRAYAEKHGYTVLKTFREAGVSGTLDETNRPAFQGMLTEILKDSVRVVIVEGLDRLAREYRIQESLLVYLASKGITLISTGTEEDVTAAMLDDPMKKALVQIQGIFSELEKSLLVKKLRVARERIRAEQGKCEGAKSYREIDPVLVREIQILRRKPKGLPESSRRSYSEIARVLNERGRTTKQGRPFTSDNVRMILKRTRR